MRVARVCTQTPGQSLLSAVLVMVSSRPVTDRQSVCGSEQTLVALWHRGRAVTCRRLNATRDARHSVTSCAMRHEASKCYSPEDYTCLAHVVKTQNFENQNHSHATYWDRLHRCLSAETEGSVTSALSVRHTAVHSPLNFSESKFCCHYCYKSCFIFMGLCVVGY